LQELESQLATGQALRCDYEQTRTISGMSRPLRSTGELEIIPGSGLVFRQKTPFALTLRITPDQIETTLENQPAETLTARENPRLFQFNQLLDALIRADHAALEKIFDLTLTGTQAAWTLDLRPRDDLLSGIFRKITLSGARHIDGIRIEDQQNDTTTLRFSNHRPPSASSR
ncbi:MAG: outer membrane lipoprotein carrier protein LolA, partial [Opitutaceae bacterium]|nr:outer membrane lipoprotein carrier protein LolA [Opitutaceae bacterium]